MFLCQVDWVGWTCATCYGIVIPCFLAFLFAKQHVIMQKADTFMTPVTKQNGKASVHLQEIVNEEGVHTSKDRGKYLLAAAAAYVAARAKGRAFVELQDGLAMLVHDNVKVMMVTFGHYAETDEEFSVESLMSHDAKEVEVLRYNVMRRMLTERTVMEESQADRYLDCSVGTASGVMLGAKDLFCKYAKCQNVWLEISSKVAAAALVSVVSSRDGLWLSIAITLGMALTIGFVQPFACRQANILQTTCFTCLALAAVGFHHHIADLAEVLEGSECTVDSAGVGREDPCGRCGTLRRRSAAHVMKVARDRAIRLQSQGDVLSDKAVCFEASRTNNEREVVASRSELSGSRRTSKDLGFSSGGPQGLRAIKEGGDLLEPQSAEYLAAVQGCCWTRLGDLEFRCGRHLHLSSLMGECQSKEEVEGRLTAAEEDIKQEFELSKQALKDWVDQQLISSIQGLHFMECS
eukprot:s47_g13.t1